MSSVHPSTPVDRHRRVRRRPHRSRPAAGAARPPRPAPDTATPEPTIGSASTRRPPRRRPARRSPGAPARRRRPRDPGRVGRPVAVIDQTGLADRRRRPGRPATGASVARRCPDGRRTADTAGLVVDLGGPALRQRAHRGPVRGEAAHRPAACPDPTDAVAFDRVLILRYVRHHRTSLAARSVIQDQLLGLPRREEAPTGLTGRGLDAVRFTGRGRASPWRRRRA